MQKYKILSGFSLIEILVGLIIVSVALAAFAPIMNKKVRAQATTIDTKLSTNCSSINSNCQLCQGTKFCVQCKNSCNVDHKLRVSDCQCI